MNRKTHIDMFGVVALIAIALNFGLNQIVIKFSNGGFQPLFMACLRSAGAGIVLLIWMRIRKIPFFLPRSSLIFGALAGVFFALEFSLLFTALDLTTVSRSSIIFYSMPVWLALILHFAVPDEKLSVLRFIGLLLAMLGVFIALFDRQDEQGNLLGDILSLFAALCWAAIALLVRITPLSKISAEQQLLCQLVVSAPILLIMSLGYGTLLRDVEFIHVIGLAYQNLCHCKFWIFILVLAHEKISSIIGGFF